VHRLKLAGLPPLQALSWEEAPAPHAMLCAHGGVSGSRVWAVPTRGAFRDGTLVTAEPAGTRITDLVANAASLAVTVSRVDRLPPRVEHVEVWQGGKAVKVQGQAVALGGDAAVVVDQVARVVRCVRAGEVKEVAALEAGMDRLNPPMVTVSADGLTALCMDARSERGDASLEQVDLVGGGKTRLLGPLPPPSWVAGASSPSGRVAASVMRLGDAPRFSVVELRPGREARTVFEVAGLQPWGAPVFVTADVVALCCCLAPNPLTFSGEAQVVLVHLDGGAPVPVTQAEGLRGRLHVAQQALWLEGGKRLGVLRLKDA
jgi:hypothetical protein